jgi:hypothetical protein
MIVQALGERTFNACSVFSRRWRALDDTGSDEYIHQAGSALRAEFHNGKYGEFTIADRLRRLEDLEIVQRIPLGQELRPPRVTEDQIIRTGHASHVTARRRNAASGRRSNAQVGGHVGTERRPIQLLSRSLLPPSGGGSHTARNGRRSLDVPAGTRRAVELGTTSIARPASRSGSPKTSRSRCAISCSRSRGSSPTGIGGG